MTTLRRHLEYVGTILPNTLLEATGYALDLGAVEVMRGSIPYVYVLQELVACRPELLDWPASLVLYDAGQEKEGMIVLERDGEAVFLFRSYQSDAGEQAVSLIP